MPTENIDYTDKTTGDNFTAADANDIKSAVNTNAGLQLINAPVLSSLPAVTSSKAGEPFSYNGTLWTYAKTGQFGTLAEGTPWPVKGYKDWVAEVEGDINNVDTWIVNSVFSNSIGLNITNIVNNNSGYSLSEQFSGIGSSNAARILPTAVFNIDYDSIDNIIVAIPSNDGILIYLNDTPSRTGAIPPTIFQIRIYPPQS